MDRFNREEVRGRLFSAWTMFVLLLGIEAQLRRTPVFLFRPFIGAIVGERCAWDVYSHVTNFSASYFLVFAGAATLTQSKLWWYWVAAVLGDAFLSLVVFRSTLGWDTAPSLTMSLVLLPFLFAIGEVLKRRWPRVGITGIWAT